MQLDYLRRDKLRLLGRWVQPTFSGGFWMHWARAKSFMELGFEGVDGRMAFLDHNHFMLEREVRAIEEAAQLAVQSEDSGFFRDFSRSAENTIDLFLKTEGKSLRDYEKGDLEKAFSEFVFQMRELVSPWSVSILLSYGVEKEIESLVARERLNPSLAASYVRVPKPTLLMQHDTRSAELARKISGTGLLSSIKGVGAEEALEVIRKQDPATHDEIRRHLKEFDWVGTHHFWGNGRDAKKLLEHILGLPPKKEATPQEIPEHLKYVFGIAGELAFYRQYAAEASDLVGFRLRPVFDKVGERLGLGNDYIWLTDSELLNSLQGKLRVSEEEIAARKKKYGIVVKDGEDIVIVGKELEDILEALLQKIDASLREWKGTPASQGRAAGKARIIMHPKDVEEMLQGEILVTNQTTPDFVPAMRKAAAIVTDLGGITCHAAIVSRELNIPCVIGTKIATKWLKDGDEVEVDATNGVVRKL